MRWLSQAGTSCQLRSVVAGAAILVAGCELERAPVPANSPPAPQVAPSAASSPPLLAASGAPGDSVVAIDAAGEVVHVVPVGRDPKLLAAAGAQVWALCLGDGALTRIDPATTATTTVRLPGDIVGMTVDGDTVFATHDGRWLSRIPGTGAAASDSVELAREPIFALRNAGFLAVADGVAWLTIPDFQHGAGPQSLWEVDVRSSERRSTYPLGPNPLSPLVASGAVWVPVLGSRSVTRLDLATRELTHVDVGDFPVGVASTGDAIWVVTERNESVLRLDPADGLIEATIDIPGWGRGITAGGGMVWVSTEIGVSRIDPATNRAVQTVPLMSRIRHGQGPTELAWLDGLLWVAIE